MLAYRKINGWGYQALLLMTVLFGLLGFSTAFSAAPSRVSALSVTPQGELQAVVSQPVQTTVFYRTVGSRYQVIWDLENAQWFSATGPQADWLNEFRRQWPSLVSASVQSFSGPVIRVRLEWQLSEGQVPANEPMVLGVQTRSPQLKMSASLLAPATVAATPSSSSSFSLPAVSSAMLSGSSASAEDRLRQLESETQRWQRQAEQALAEKQAAQSQMATQLAEQQARLTAEWEARLQHLQRQSQSITAQADYDRLKQALEQSKVALAKAIETINKQNETLQGLKSQVAELQGGLDTSSLDQQTYLNEELTKAEQAQKQLRQKLADAERENAALKLVVDGLKKQQAQAALVPEALTPEAGWNQTRPLIKPSSSKSARQAS